MIEETLQERTAVIESLRQHFVIREDCSGPIRSVRAHCNLPNRLWNAALLLVRQSLGQRTRIRISFECLTRYSATSAYKRLRAMSVQLDCASAKQAELAIEAILTFAQSLDGKWLAPAETSVTPDSSSVKVSQVNGYLKDASNSPAIGTQLATDSPEHLEQSQANDASGLGNEQVSVDSGNPRAGK